MEGHLPAVTLAPMQYPGLIQGEQLPEKQMEDMSSEKDTRLKVPLGKGPRTSLIFSFQEDGAWLEKGDSRREPKRGGPGHRPSKSGSEKKWNLKTGSRHQRDDPERNQRCTGWCWNQGPGRGRTLLPDRKVKKLQTIWADIRRTLEDWNRPL